MASGLEAESSQNDEGLAELARRIQIGDQTAIRAFRSMFLPGIEFLLRRKLERSTAGAEVERVLTAAVQEIEKASPAQARNLSQLVTRTIHRVFPAARHSAKRRRADAPTENLAHSILTDRTMLERDILRRYYVLGESRDEIRVHLRVSARTIEEAVARARADFRGKRRSGGSA